MNKKATATVKRLLGDTQPVSLASVVKQETAPGPVLNNCSLDRVSKDDTAYNTGSVQSQCSL